MRSVPYTALHQNLAWTLTGSVWAGWRLHGLSYGCRSVEDKKLVADLHRALYRVLPDGEALILSLSTSISPAAVVTKMLEGVDDWDQVPDWVDECWHRLDELEQMDLGERTYWLFVPLANTGWDVLVEPAHSAHNRLMSATGAAVAGPAPKRIAARVEQARVIGRSLPAPFHPQPVSVGQQVWIWEHAASRGLASFPVQDDTIAARDFPSAPSLISNPIIDEGAKSDSTQRKAWARRNPLATRYLKITTPVLDDLGQDPSYQATVVLSDLPAAGMRFPGSEYLGRIDESGVPHIDVAVRIRKTNRTKVLKDVAKAVAHLNDQYSQREAAQTTGHHALDLACDQLSAYQQIIENDPNEVRIDHTTIFAVPGPDGPTAQERSKDLVAYLTGLDMGAERPPGALEDLWWQMMPGIPTGRISHAYRQTTTAADFALACPFLDTSLGDQSGPLPALNTTNPGQIAPLHLHLSSYSGKDGSASIAVVGDKGSGKALALQTPIPTPAGWTRMGDLVPGDEVFDDQGHPTVVVGVSPVMTGHRCYEIVFSDRSTLVADAEHLWTTVPQSRRSRGVKANYRARARGARPVDLISHTDELTGPGWWQHGTQVTTEQIRGSLLAGDASNHAVPTTAALDLPQASLPIDAYLLGCWLGDGSSRGPYLSTADPERLRFIETNGYIVKKLADRYAYAIGLQSEPAIPTPEIRACEHCGTSMTGRYPHRRFCSVPPAAAARAAGVQPATRARCARCGGELVASSTGRRCAGCWHADTLRGRLNVLGVLGDKHIPSVYLRASEPQRRALLAGLLDTDGTVSPSGQVQFANTNRRLAHDVQELACSLGLRAALREGRARLYGKDCGPQWIISFSTRDEVFRLTRKRTVHQQRRTRTNPARTRFRYIVAVRDVSSVPVRCIKVAAASGIYLAGRQMIPTHNTAFLKTITGQVVDTGGQALIIDRTPEGEWAHFASQIADAVTVDPMNPKHTMCPLRLLGIDAGAAVLQSFLTPLTGISPQSAAGATLMRVIDPDYLHRHQITSSHAVMQHLENGCPEPGAAEIGAQLRAFSRLRFAEVILGESQPAPSLDAPAIVWRTFGFELPTAAELASAHLFAQMRIEKVFGRAYYALLTSLCRALAFRDRTRFTLWVADEVAYLTSSPEAERETVTFVREDRRAYCALAAASQLAGEDLGSEKLQELITTRMLFRQPSMRAGRVALNWAGLDPNDPQFEQTLTRLVEDTSPKDHKTGIVPVQRRGEFFMRHTTGSVGWGKVLLPSTAHRAAAVLSTPPTRDALAFSGQQAPPPQVEVDGTDPIDAGEGGT